MGDNHVTDEAEGDTKLETTKVVGMKENDNNKILIGRMAILEMITFKTRQRIPQRLDQGSEP